MAGEPTWSQALIPSADDGDWRHVLDGRSLPPSLGPRKDVSSELSNPDLLYVRLNHISVLNDQPFENKLWDILFDASRHHPRAAIVDLRFNHGGDISKALFFAKGLVELVGEKGSIIVLSGRATISAAIVMEAQFRSLGHDRVQVFGEPLGDNPQWWSEGGEVTLANSGIEVTYAQKRWDLLRRCDYDERCYWLGRAYASIVPTIAPDRTILVFCSIPVWGGSRFSSSCCGVGTETLTLKVIDESRSHGGRQLVVRHASRSTSGEMTFSIFLPPQTEQSARLPVVWYLPASPAPMPT